MGRNQLLSSSTSCKVRFAVHRLLLWLEGPRVVAPLLTLLLLHLLLRGPPALAVHHPIPTKAGDGKNLPRRERTIVPSTPIPPQTQPAPGHRAEFHFVSWAQVGLVTLISPPSSQLKPFYLSRVLHAPPTSISLFKRFPRLGQGSQCTSPAFRSPHHGVTLSMRRWVHMSPLCIQMFNVADAQTVFANVSAEDVTCCLEHKLHLDVRGVQGQGGHMWLVHFRERGAWLRHIQPVGGGSDNCFETGGRLLLRPRSAAAPVPAPHPPVPPCPTTIPLQTPPTHGPNLKPSLTWYLNPNHISCPKTIPQKHGFASQPCPMPHNHSTQPTHKPDLEHSLIWYLVTMATSYHIACPKTPDIAWYLILNTWYLNACYLVSSTCSVHPAPIFTAIPRPDPTHGRPSPQTQM